MQTKKAIKKYKAIQGKSKCLVVQCYVITLFTGKNLCGNIEPKVLLPAATKNDNGGWYIFYLANPIAKNLVTLFKVYYSLCN